MILALVEIDLDHDTWEWLLKTVVGPLSHGPNLFSRNQQGIDLSRHGALQLFVLRFSISIAINSWAYFAGISSHRQRLPDNYLLH